MEGIPEIKVSASAKSEDLIYCNRQPIPPNVTVKMEEAIELFIAIESGTLQE